jgi:hypothetical protein
VVEVVPSVLAEAAGLRSVAEEEITLSLELPEQ